MSREAFEAFMGREHGNMSLDRIGTGEYREWFVWRTWEAWQAAQADAYERAVEIVRQWDADSPAIDAIRALAKEAQK